MQSVVQMAHADGDIYLQLSCVLFLKNFFMDTNVRVQKYAYQIEPILTFCNKIMLAYSEQKGEQCFMAFNEILELYRYIVEKYAAFSKLTLPNGSEIQNTTITVELAVFLNDNLWVKHGQRGQGQDYIEHCLRLTSVMRVMTHILAKIPIEDMPKDGLQRLLEISFSQCT